MSMAVARRIRFALPILFWFGCGALAQAQTAPIPKTSSPSSTATDVTIGQSAAPLYGPWKFTVGDSPIDPATHQPLWAEPGFDDSKWETVDLTPEEGATDPILGNSGYVPGWTAKGHPGYRGYGWYRIRVHVDVQPGQRLALEEPPDIDDVYQVFANGRLLGSFGDFSANPPVDYYAQPAMFALPQGMVENAEFSLMRFKLAEGDRLVMVSDGVAEATDASGRLFGFERVAELLRTAVSAAAVAQAAQSFGQGDDISVVSVRRMAAAEAVPA